MPPGCRRVRPQGRSGDRNSRIRQTRPRHRSAYRCAGGRASGVTSPDPSHATRSVLTLMISGGWSCCIPQEVATARRRVQCALLVVGVDVEGRLIDALGLIGRDQEDSADPEGEGASGRVDGLERRPFEGQRKHQDVVAGDARQLGRRRDDRRRPAGWAYRRRRKRARCPTSLGTPITPPAKVRLPLVASIATIPETADGTSVPKSRSSILVSDSGTRISALPFASRSGGDGSRSGRNRRGRDCRGND